MKTLRQGLGWLLAGALLAGCGLPFSAPVIGNSHEDHDFHAHGKGIPTTPGAPNLGQQPLIPQDPELGLKTIPLTLLYTADVHSRVDPFPDQFYHRTYAGKGGFSRIAAAAAEFKRRNPNTLLLDSGDYLQGSPYFNFFKGDVELRAMQEAGYDAITIGNHEFDNGIPALRRALKSYKGPVITTNVTFSPEIGQRYAVLKVGALRVGLFGLLTEVSGLVTPPNFNTAQYYDPIQTARAAVAKLKKEADVIVCMSHVGIVPPWSEEDEPKGGKVTDERIAEAVPGIDVILSGHTHAMVGKPRVIRSGKHKTLIVAPGYGGGFLGRLNLELKKGVITSVDNSLVPLTASVGKDQRVERIIAPYRQEMDQTIKRNIGRAQGDFRRYGTDDYESSLNNLIADATMEAARKINKNVDFGMSSSGTPRNYIMSGNIQIEDVYYALPFDNEVVIVEAKGKTVVDMLTTQRRWTDHKRHAISNVTYTLDPAKRQISDIKIGGQPFDPNKTYTIAINDYMADGGSGFSMIPGLKRQNTKILQRDALIEYIQKVGTLFPQTGRIKIRGRVSYLLRAA